MLTQTENNSTTKKSRGGQSTSPEVVDRILSLARQGWTRTAIAKEVGVSDRIVTSKCHNNGIRFPRGGPSTPPEVVARILSLARKGWTRTAIAKECGVSDRTVTTICHKNGFRFPCGGNRYGNKTRATMQEAPGGIHDKAISVDSAWSYANSAYTAGQLQIAYRGQRALPKRLKKIFGGEAGRFIKI